MFSRDQLHSYDHVGFDSDKHSHDEHVHYKEVEESVFREVVDNEFSIYKQGLHVLADCPKTV